MDDTNETNKLFGIVSVTTSKTTDYNWRGQVKNETRNVTVEIIAEVPQPFLDAAASIANAGPRIVAGAQAASSAIKARALDALPAPQDKKA